MSLADLKLEVQDLVSSAATLESLAVQKNAAIAQTASEIHDLLVAANTFIESAKTKLAV